MKYLIGITGAILISYVILSSTVLTAKPQEVVPPDNTSVQSQSEEKSLYVVKEYNGKLAVFENGENKPFRITDLYVNILPDYDKKLLKEGIYVKDSKELKKVLEDYLS